MVKRLYIIKLHMLIERIKNEKAKFGFTYGLNKNAGLIKNDIESLKVVETSLDAILKDFVKERNEFIEKHGKASVNGQVQITPDNPEFEKFIVYLEELKTKYDAEFKEYEIKAKEYETLKDEPVEVEIYKIKSEYIPDDMLTADDIDTLMVLGIIE